MTVFCSMGLFKLLSISCRNIRIRIIRIRNWTLIMWPHFPWNFGIIWWYLVIACRFERGERGIWKCVEKFSEISFSTRPIFRLQPENLGDVLCHAWIFQVSLVSQFCRKKPAIYYCGVGLGHCNLPTTWVSLRKGYHLKIMCFQCWIGRKLKKTTLFRVP